MPLRLSIHASKVFNDAAAWTPHVNSFVIILRNLGYPNVSNLLQTRARKQSSVAVCGVGSLRHRTMMWYRDLRTRQSSLFSPKRIYTIQEF